jgi:hypothetical protein
MRWPWGRGARPDRTIDDSCLLAVAKIARSSCAEHHIARDAPVLGSTAATRGPKQYSNTYGVSHLEG